MLSVSTGHSVRYYTDATTEGRENYYTGAVAQGEPPGRWYGIGAESLGLRGQVRAQDMIGLYEQFVDPRDPQFKCPEAWDEASKLGHGGRNYATENDIYTRLLAAEPHADAARRDALRVQAGQQARHNVSFYDVTFSVQKSITVLHAAFESQEIAARRIGDTDSAEAWGVLRKAVEDAIWAGNNAGLDYLAAHAGYSRVGHHGGAGGRWIDAHDWTVASFFQHDSRDHDPQLHIHNTALNRVLCSDGVWRTIDGKGITAFRPAAAAVAERTTEAHLARSIGVLAAMRPDGKSRELVGVDQEVCDLLSSRRRAITPRAAELITAFEERHGREPTALERDRLARQANLTTRRTKTRLETTEQRLDRVEAQVATELQTGLGEVAAEALRLAGADRLPPARWSAREVIETALAAVQDQRAAWTRGELTREISNALPDNLGITDGALIAELLDELTDQALALAVPLDMAKPGDVALARQLQLEDGSSAFLAPGRARYATPEHLHTERLLVAATTTRDGRAAATVQAQAFVRQLAESGIELGPDQRAVITGVLTSGARVESLVGPAGAGKSFVLGVLAQAWSDPNTWPGTDPAPAGRVVGLAASQKAAEVLRAEGLSAANTAAWLAAQTRIADGRPVKADQQWQLGASDLVVVDESSMADTSSLAAVHERVRQAGAKLLLVGDHRQLGAVSAGGLGELLAEHGSAYELTEVRRFAHDWESTASLRLRAGDPSALEDYHREGRIRDGGTIESAEAQATRGWLADTLAGKESVLVVDSNEQAARINAGLRAQLVALGRVAEDGVVLGRDGTTAGVGDIVQARRLAWELAGHEGNTRGPINREHYRILETREDGALIVAPVNGEAGERMVLPAGYVDVDLTLGYAATVHAVQGITVDTGHTVATSRTAATSLYPAATRGRDANHLYVVTRSAADDAQPGQLAQAVTRNPRAVLATILDNAETERSATALQAESAAEATSMRTIADRLGAVAEIAVAERTSGWLDELTAAGDLTVVERRRLAAEDGVGKLAPVLRRIELAGGDARAELAEAVTGRSLVGAQAVSNVLVHRLTHERGLDPVGTSLADWAPATTDPGLAAQLAHICAAGDARRDELATELIADPPSWAHDTLGDIPDDATARTEWAQRAATIAAHRELVGHDDSRDLLGPAPSPTQAEAYASWRAAWRASGQPDIDRAERAMTDGQLRIRVRAYQRELPWAPRRVTNELTGTLHAAEHHRQTATIKTAEAETAREPAERDRLHQEAADATALADTLESQLPQLRELDDRWFDWFVHTAPTRAEADRAHAELANRGSLHTPADQHVTAEEWAAVRNSADRAEDAHREITEHDLTDDHDQVAEHGQDNRAVAEAKRQVQPIETVDLRELAAGEEAGADEDTIRVPTAEEASDSVRRAERALAEIRSRDSADAAREAEATEYASRVSYWHTSDRNTEAEQIRDSSQELEQSDG